MRLKQFVIPKAEGDTEPTILVVSAFRGGGNINQNLPRWRGEFAGGAKEAVTAGKSPQGPYVIAVLTGTHRGSSFARRKEPLENGTVATLVRPNLSPPPPKHSGPQSAQTSKPKRK